MEEHEEIDGGGCLQKGSGWVAGARMVMGVTFTICIFIIYFIYLVLERGEEREGEKHQSVAPCMCPNQGPNLQPRHVSDLESSWRPFALRGDTHPAEPHQSGLPYVFSYSLSMLYYICVLAI